MLRLIDRWIIGAVRDGMKAHQASIKSLVTYNCDLEDKPEWSEIVKLVNEAPYLQYACLMPEYYDISELKLELISERHLKLPIMCYFSLTGVLVLKTLP